jgi:hypothetical protein
MFSEVINERLRQLRLLARRAATRCTIRERAEMFRVRLGKKIAICCKSTWSLTIYKVGCTLLFETKWILKNCYSKVNPTLKIVRGWGYKYADLQYSYSDFFLLVGRWYRNLSTWMEDRINGNRPGLSQPPNLEAWLNLSRSSAQAGQPDWSAQGPYVLSLSRLNKIWWLAAQAAENTGTCHVRAAVTGNPRKTPTSIVHATVLHQSVVKKRMMSYRYIGWYSHAQYNRLEMRVEKRRLLFGQRQGKS